MSTQHTLGFGASILSAMVSAAPDKLPAVILALARNGDLDTLETIVANHAVQIDDLRRAPGSTYSDFSYAVLPLAASVPSEQRQRAERLTAEWLDWCDAKDPKMIYRHLVECTDEQIAAELVRLGGAALDAQGFLSLHVVRKFEYEERSPDFIATIVEAAAEVGHYAPLEAALRALTETRGYQHYNHLTGRLDKIALPGLLSGERAKSIPKNLAEQCTVIDGAAPHQQGNIVGTWLTILQKIEVSDDEWKMLVGRWAPTRETFNAMCDARWLADESTDALRRMLSAGVALDDLLANLPGKRDPVPIIHRAIHANNSKLVQFLLDAGADPLHTIKFQRKSKRAEEFAPTDSPTAHLLAARRAKAAMEKTAAAARSKP